MRWLYYNRSYTLAAFETPARVVHESVIIVPGEDEASTAYDDNQRPVRSLDEFTLVDCKSRTLLSLVDCQELDIPDRSWSAYGIVRPLFIDEAAAADYENLEEEAPDKQHIHIPKIIRFTIDFTKHHE